MNKDTEGRSAESTLANEILDIHPAYNTDNEALPNIWKTADIVRDLLEKKGEPDEQGRKDLLKALEYQVHTLTLYGKVLAFYKADAKNEAPSEKMTVYVLLFPGSAKDNTGIKDLNDKVLGYQRTGEFLKKRFYAILDIFNPDFSVTAQSYKTALFYTLKQPRKEFDERLLKLDQKLRDILLKEILPEAEKDPELGSEKKKEVRKLKKTLQKNPKYKFDLFYGLTSLEAKGDTSNTYNIIRYTTNTVFLLVTEALKGAAIARFISKGKSLEVRVAKKFKEGIKKDRGFDLRGKEYKADTYLKASKKASDIKKMMTKKPTADNSLDYYRIYINTVWTVTFLKYQRRRRQFFIGNPEVIRDVRKKKLEKPTLKSGVKLTFKAQKELLELWLVVLNMLDFIKDFLTSEFQEVLKYHNDSFSVYNDMVMDPTKKIDWATMERILTRDVRQTIKIAVLGTTSEFQFYSFVADYEKRIFFSMDIRDLGVGLMLLYEDSNEEIEDHKYRGIPLMKETFRASDPIIERKRFTYERVVITFHRYYLLLASRAPRERRMAEKKEVRKAFGSGIRTTEKIPEFTKAVQIMLGGDEIFVAVHPYFEPYIHEIIRDLDAMPFKKGTLDMRTAVTYSQANKEKGPAQREKNQKSHKDALKLADEASGPLKDLERRHQRIERLIIKLEANEKKKDQAPEFTKELEKLGLIKLFARFKHGNPKVMPARDFKRVIQRFKAENIREACREKHFELVDFSGQVIDKDKLVEDAEDLETRVRKEVGRDNINVEPPPSQKHPKWIERLLEKLFPKDPTKNL